MVRRALALLALVTAFLVITGDSLNVGAVNAQRAALVSTMYGHASQSVKYWASADEIPAEFQYVVDIVDGVIPDPDVELGLFQIVYDATDLPQFVVHVKGTGHRRALIYSNGHAELPTDPEGFTVEFLRAAFEDGYDLLIAALPLVGVNIPDADRVGGYHMRARDSAVATAIDPVLLTSPSKHAMFDLIDDPDHFMHYFIDGPYLTLNLVTGTPNPAGVSDDYQGPMYDTVDLVGLSGSGATGLITCAADLVSHCVLIAPLATEDLRLVDARNVGDVEQIDSGFYRRFPIRELLKMADSNGPLTLVYNRKDPCCYADPAASEMQRRFPEYNIILTDLDIHGFVPQNILGLLND